jgi:hypothetical protein
MTISIGWGPAARTVLVLAGLAIVVGMKYAGSVLGRSSWGVLRARQLPGHGRGPASRPAGLGGDSDDVFQRGRGNGDGRDCALILPEPVLRGSPNLRGTEGGANRERRLLTPRLWLCG